MVNKDSNRYHNRKMGLVLIVVGFVLMLTSALIIGSEMLNFLSFVLLGGGLITVLTNLKKLKKTKEGR